MDAPHGHPPEAACTPDCPRWSEWALHFYFLQRRWGEMLEACRAAECIEWVMVAPGVSGVQLPAYLMEEQLIRLNLVAGRDTPEVFLDEWGIRCELTFRGVRSEVAVPWGAIVAGTLRPPERKRPRFGVIQGGKKD
ncbi:MAG TPA: hypothetical protein VFM53_08910 [Anaeromyxobacteraceae bacterium]|nr:hypothetical protein [Anaeromyxobacteraceae bacterium]